MHHTDNYLSVPGVGSILEVRKSNFGFGLPAGLDYALTTSWHLNADAKHTWKGPELNDNAGLGIDTKLNVDPWMFGRGVGYRFSPERRPRNESPGPRRGFLFDAPRARYTFCSLLRPVRRR